MLTRRCFVAASLLPTLAFARTSAASTERFVFVILRGGLDGLAVVPAVGDPDFAPARGALARDSGNALPLHGPFALHPALPQLHAMYGRGELAVLHAVGLPYRQRSHFDAQQVLESGGAQPYLLSTGWLGRALAAGQARGMALNIAVPLVLRGKEGIDTWAPSVLPEPGAELVARLEGLYANDRVLAQALSRAKGLRDAAMPTAMAPGGPGRAAQTAALARKAGEFFAHPEGPQVAVMELGGWDTHANQNGSLAANLPILDGALQALREALGSAWPRTVVVVATEFGREVAINGTMGTDHGSGGAAFVLGGAVHGGRVIADWPGLAKTQRYEGRDLQITTDLRAPLKALLAEHLRVPSGVIEREVFPDSGQVRALQGLLRG